MRYIGVDVHKDRCYATAVDEMGKVKERKEFPNDRVGWVEYIRGLKGDVEVAIEATNYSLGPYDLLCEYGIEVAVGNPSKIRLIADSNLKTDKIDSEVLAQLLRTNFLPRSYIPSPADREMRQLLRTREELGHDMTQVKNRVHAILGRHQIKVDMTDLFGVKGREYLEQLELGRTEKLELRHHLAHIDFLTEEKEYLDKVLAEKAVDNEKVRLLMTIPGIGYYTALVVVYEIGDIERFGNSRKLCSYSGLTPKLRESGDKTKIGHTRRDTNHHLKWVLVEAVHQATRYPGKLRARHQRLSRRRGSKIATVASARRLLQIIYCMLKTGEEYRDSIPVLADRKYKEMDARASKRENEEIKAPPTRPSLRFKDKEVLKPKDDGDGKSGRETKVNRGKSVGVVEMTAQGPEERSLARLHFS